MAEVFGSGSCCLSTVEKNSCSSEYIWREGRLCWFVAAAEIAFWNSPKLSRAFFEIEIFPLLKLPGFLPPTPISTHLSKRSIQDNFESGNQETEGPTKIYIRSQDTFVPSEDMSRKQYCDQREGLGKHK